MSPINQQIAQENDLESLNPPGLEPDRRSELNWHDAVQPPAEQMQHGFVPRTRNLYAVHLARRLPRCFFAQYALPKLHESFPVVLGERFGQPPEVVAIVRPFFLLNSLSLIPVFYFQVQRQYLDALGRPW